VRKGRLFCPLDWPSGRTARRSVDATLGSLGGFDQLCARLAAICGDVAVRVYPSVNTQVPLRVLSISTLFPSPARPHFGLFVARQAQALARHSQVEMVVIHPVALAMPPFDRLLNPAALRGLPARAHDWGVQVHYARYRYVPRSGPQWSPASITRAVLPLARRLHAEAPFDLVDAQFFYPDGPAAASVARALGLPLSIKARGSDIHFIGKKPFARRAMLAAAEQAAGLLAVSEALRCEMTAFGMPASKIAVHYTGLDHTQFRPLPRSQTRTAIADLVPGDGPLLASVGNLIALKGHDLSIAALAHLPGVRLVIAGSGPEERALLNLADKLGVADRLVLARPLPAERLAVLLSAAQAMVLPSSSEGLANAWVEALACGTPLVIPDVGGAREVLRESSAGRIIERNAEAIAGAVRELLADPPEQAAVSASAARFSWEVNAAELAAHYARIVGRDPT
jgi:teichuronic acid biosynthesis glycosyltransferase TuaC